MIFVLLILATSIIRLSPVNFGSHAKENYGEYCPTLDLTGWNDFSNDFSALSKSDIEKHVMKPNSFIVINKWFPGGHLEFYASRKSGLPIIGIGNLEDLHKFVWLNKERNKLKIGDDAYCIVPSNVPSNPKDLYKEYFSNIEEPIVIGQVRNKGVVRYFYVYRMKGCKKIPSMILH